MIIQFNRLASPRNPLHHQGNGCHHHSSGADVGNDIADLIYPNAVHQYGHQKRKADQKRYNWHFHNFLSNLLLQTNTDSKFPTIAIDFILTLFFAILKSLLKNYPTLCKTTNLFGNFWQADPFPSIALSASRIPVCFCISLRLVRLFSASVKFQAFFHKKLQNSDIQDPRFPL